MARPQKISADYFSHSSNLRNDTRIRSLRRKYEHIGYSIYMQLRELICGADYFHLRFDNNALEDIAGDVLAEAEIVQEIANYCVQRGLFKMVVRNNITYLTDYDLIRSLSDLLAKRKQSAEKFIQMFSDAETPGDDVFPTRKPSNKTVSDAETLVSDAETPQTILNKTELNTLASGTQEWPQSIPIHGKEDSTKKAEGNTTGERKTNPGKTTQPQPRDKTQLVQQWVVQYTGDWDRMNSVRFALRSRGEQESDEYIKQLLTSFAPKFAMFQGEFTYSKFCYKFGDFINDEKRKSSDKQQSQTPVPQYLKKTFN